MRAYFECKVSQGKTKVQAMICIMRRLVSIIYSMMKNQTVYQMPVLTIETIDEKGEKIS